MSRETLDLIECRLAATDDAGTIEAIALRFNTVDTYKTTFDPAAFGDLNRRIPMLWAHDPAQVIGSWSEFRITKTELRAKGALNLDIARAVEIRSMLAKGDIDGASVGFETIRDERRPGGIRHILEARLWELSLVPFASVPGARVTSIRSGRDDATADFINAVRSAVSVYRGK